MTLAAEDGWSLRNDLSLNLGDLGQQLYVGLDVGRVGGQSAQFLSGRTLVGSVAGLRGRVACPVLPMRSTPATTCRWVGRSRNQKA